MSIISASSYHPNTATAVTEISRRFAHCGPGLLLFFCSSHYNLSQLGEQFNHALPGTQVVGCTSAGELSPQGYAQNSITAIYFPNTASVSACALIQDMANFSLLQSQELVDGLLNQLHQSQVAPITDNTFAITLLDGLSIHEEQLLQVLNTSLGQIPLLGGSAGDDLHFEHTEIYYQGEFYQHAAVLLLVNTRHAFAPFSHHHLQAKHEKLVVTDANAGQRRVYELNGLPAAQEYARICGLEVCQLSTIQFALHPLTVKMGDQYYARSVQQVHTDLSLSFYSAIEIGVVLTDAQPHDIVTQTQAWLGALEQQVGPPELVLAFDCIFRSLEINQRQLQPAMNTLLNSYQVAGFSTYGEQVGGCHLNHTLTGIYFGAEKDHV
ncbi:MAG TPA: GfdT protein [Oceanospirillaceae bacterium]|nr:GfdT protein [Oceanospirillaceae bacterium]